MLFELIEEALAPFETNLQNVEEQIAAGKSKKWIMSRCGIDGENAIKLDKGKRSQETRNRKKY